ncbi:MAG: glycosyltransferase family 4 protein [Pyrinomonadaceae bacterium]|nr:glycosyltransferase family 4 protein [Pyrinomonadaceae bacterium]
MLEILVFLTVFASSTVLVWIYLKVSPTIGAIDVPNDRSSHSTPIPRGGGIAIVIVSLFSYAALSYAGVLNFHVLWFISAFVIALVGFVDDLYSIPLLPRLIVQLIVAGSVVYFHGSVTGIYVPYWYQTLAFGSLAPIISIVFIVGMINAFNFMDGIDGIAATQGIVIGISWAAVGYLHGSQSILIIGLIFSASCLGFIVFNWQPARVFMGDTGSTYLGFVFGSLPVILADQSSIQAPELLLLAVLFAWLFIYDTVVTRAVQIIRGRKFWLPHREHQYQRLVINGVAHSQVSFYFGLSGVIVSAAGYHIAIVKGEWIFVSIAIIVVISALLSIWTIKKRLT